MEMLYFLLGFMVAAMLGMGALMLTLLMQSRKPPGQMSKTEFERQLGNLLRYNGTAAGQKGRETDEDD